MRFVFSLLASLIISVAGYGQPKPFEQGFAKGFKEGYCYNQSITCLPPLTPLCPLPRVNENENSFTDGYNRGFQTGLDLRRVEGGATNSTSFPSMPNYRFNDYIPEVPVNAYVNVLLYKRALAEKRADWISKRIQDIRDLNYVLLFSIYKKAYEVRGKSLTDFVSNQLNAKNIDLTDNSVFRQIVDIFSKMQATIYEDYAHAKAEMQEFIVNDDNSIEDKKISVAITYNSDDKYVVKGVKANSHDSVTLETKAFLAPLIKNDASDDNTIIYVYVSRYESYYQLNYGFLKKNLGKAINMDFIGSTRMLLISNDQQFIIYEDGKSKDGVDFMGERQFLTKSGQTFTGSYYQSAKEGKFFICPYEVGKNYYLAYPLYTIFR